MHASLSSTNYLNTTIDLHKLIVDLQDRLPLSMHDLPSFKSTKGLTRLSHVQYGV